MSVICNVADLIAAKLSPYFFFVFWTAEYAKKRQGAAALFAPKEKRVAPLLFSPPFSISSPLLSKLLQDKSLCKSAEEESDDGHEKNGPFYHPLSRERRQRKVSFHVGRLADYCRRPCNAAAVEFRLETNRIPNGATPD